MVCAVRKVSILASRRAWPRMSSRISLEGMAVSVIAGCTREMSAI